MKSIEGIKEYIVNSLKDTTGKALIVVGTMTTASGWGLLTTAGAGTTLSLLGAPWPTIVFLSGLFGVSIFQIKGGSVLANFGEKLVKESQS